MLQPHIQLENTAGARYAILPGDPARVDRIARLLENPRELAYNREFRSLTGTYRGTPILALSTGIGGCSAGIAVEELHNLGVTAMVRIGSCGALQSGIALGELILCCGAVRCDGASAAYADPAYPAVPDTELLGCCLAAARAGGGPYRVGLIHSHESFYADGSDAEARRWATLGVLGADMESAAVLTIGRLRGVRAASILNNVVLWGRDTAESVSDYAGGADPAAAGEQREIAAALEALRLLKEKDDAAACPPRDERSARL